MIKTLTMYVGQCWGQETLMRHLRVSAKTKGIVSRVRKKRVRAPTYT